MDRKLLDILCCPSTKQPLALLNGAELAALNRAISDGGVKRADGERMKQAKVLRETFEGHPPLVVSPYDAELFGHWWYEGPQFIDFFFRKLHYDQSEIQAITPGDFLDAGIPIQRQQPTASSWGENGYYKVWINEKNSWMYPYQHDAERRMTELVNRFSSDALLATEERLLKQLACELLQKTVFGFKK